jgi:hypothetical protein
MMFSTPQKSIINKKRGKKALWNSILSITK